MIFKILAILAFLSIFAVNYNVFTTNDVKALSIYVAINLINALMFMKISNRKNDPDAKTCALIYKFSAVTATSSILTHVLTHGF